MTTLENSWERRLDDFDFLWRDRLDWKEDMTRFLKETVEKAERRGAERAIRYVSYELDAAENDKEMADDPDDPKVRINYFRQILEAAKNV